MTRLIDDFGFRYPGIKNVEHVYFYSVGAVGLETRQSYLQEAYRLGKEFEPAGLNATADQLAAGALLSLA
jgi:hypothetical protein